MRLLFLSCIALFFTCVSFRGAEVQVQVAPSRKPSPSQTPQATASASAAALPQYRPALLGNNPLSVINQINTKALMEAGQKDATLSFCSSVARTGEVQHTWVYRASPDSGELEKEVYRCLDQAVLVPAVYNSHVVDVLFFGTVSFKVVNGKPRLRIFANQEAEELKKESDFVGPQPFAGRDSKFEGLHYPNDVVTEALTGLVELAMKIDANGNLKELRMVSEYPPLVGFGRAAKEDFRVARFIPAFRDGKPVECNITLPVFYSPAP
jgi:Gram-negative bacterial TonB protein C-terminal